MLAMQRVEIGMRLDAKGLEFRGKPFAHFVDLWTVGGICGDTGNGDSSREAIDEFFLERVDTIISQMKTKIVRIEECLLISHCHCA
jgi:hypothetical protein